MASKEEAMEKEIEALRRHVSTLEEDKKQSFRLMEKMQLTSKTVYLAKDKKIEKFSGKPKISGPLVCDWVEDARTQIQTISDDKGKVEFLLQHLESPAKDEVKLRPSTEVDSAEKILTLIRNLYDSGDSVGQLQQIFYQRSQKENKSLQEYSLFLMRILDQIHKHNEHALGNRDTVLRDRFIEGIRDPLLKREIRRHSFEHKTQNFLEFRQNVLTWVDENTPNWKVKLQMHETEVEASDNKIQSNNNYKTQNDEILLLLKKQQEMLTEQQKQIDNLTKLTVDTNTNPTNSGRTRGHEYKSNSYRKQGVKCYNCSGIGHMSYDCPSDFSGNKEVQETDSDGKGRGSISKCRGFYRGRGGKSRGNPNS